MMKTALLTATAICLALPAAADDLATVKQFYTDLLTTPGDVSAQVVRDVIAEDWKTTPTPLGGAGAEGFIKTLGAFGAIIPDLTWEPQQILQDGNTYVVRGRATGTPVAPFLGIEPTGKSFDIMSIDIHTVENGVITESYHVEEWATAMRQLTAD